MAKNNHTITKLNSNKQYSLKRARGRKYSTINVLKFLPASNCSKKTCRNQINKAVETETIDIFFLDALCKVQCSSFHTWLEGRFLQGDCLIWLICIPFAAFPLIFPERALSTWRLKSDALSLPFLWVATTSIDLGYLMINIGSNTRSFRFPF